MPSKKRKILAIDPGTYQIGVAFFEGKGLIYHGVKDITNRKSPHEILKTGRNIILRLIHDYKPDTLVVEKTFFANNRNSGLLNVFSDEIGSIGRRNKIDVFYYAPSTVKKYVCGYGQASKEEVAKAIVAKYPVLKVYLDQDKQWKNRYHQNMFDAVALGLSALGKERL